MSHAHRMLARTFDGFIRGTDVKEMLPEMKDLIKEWHCPIQIINDYDYKDQNGSNID